MKTSHGWFLPALALVLATSVVSEVQAAPKETMLRNLMRDYENGVQNLAEKYLTSELANSISETEFRTFLKTVDDQYGYTIFFSAAKIEEMKTNCRGYKVGSKNVNVGTPSHPYYRDISIFQDVCETVDHWVNPILLNGVRLTLEQTTALQTELDELEKEYSEKVKQVQDELQNERSKKAALPLNKRGFIGWHIDHSLRYEEMKDLELERAKIESAAYGKHFGSTELDAFAELDVDCADNRKAETCRVSKIKMLREPVEQTTEQTTE